MIAERESSENKSAGKSDVDTYMRLAHIAARPRRELFSCPIPPTTPPLVADHRRKIFLFLILMSAMFMATLDNQIVSTALPTIVGEFGHLERFGWIGSAYLLALSAVMPL